MTLSPRPSDDRHPGDRLGRAAADPDPDRRRLPPPRRRRPLAAPPVPASTRSFTVVVAGAAIATSVPLVARGHRPRRGPVLHPQRRARHRRLQRLLLRDHRRRRDPRRAARRRLPPPRGPRRPRALRAHACCRPRAAWSWPRPTTSSSCSSASRSCRSPSTCSPPCTCAASQSQEAAIKYFVLGAFSLGVLPLRHRPRLRRHRHDQPLAASAPEAPSVRRVSAERPDPVGGPPALLLAGIALLLVGFGFKVAAVPFHSWTPDVYQGSPTPVGRVHGGGRQGGRLRRAAPGPASRRSPPTPTTGSRTSTPWPWRRCSSGRCSPSCRPT